MNPNYKEKYLKYKLKYLELKQYGGMEGKQQDDWREQRRRLLEQRQKEKKSAKRTYMSLDAMAAEYGIVEKLQLELSPRAEFRDDITSVFPNLNHEFITYVKKQLIEILRLLSNHRLGDILNPEVQVLISIRSGGAFTSKISPNGRFRHEQERDELYRKSLLFIKLSNDLFNNLITENIQLNLRNQYVKVYRKVELPDIPSVPLREFIQPIPMSCTWDINFSAFEWAPRNCCVYEIIMPCDTNFLTLSNPDPEFIEKYKIYNDMNDLDENEQLLQEYWNSFLSDDETTAKKKKITEDTKININVGNQSQSEVTLPPSKLTLRGSEVRRLINPTNNIPHDVPVYTYLLEPLIDSRFPLNKEQIENYRQIFYSFGAE